MGHAHLDIPTCNSIQTEGEHEDTIVDRTIQRQGPKKRHTTDTIPAPAYFEKDHGHDDRLKEGITIETEE